MATSTFSNAWIHDASDLGDNLEITYYSPMQENFDREGETIRFAGGNFRTINKTGVRRQLTVEFTWLTRIELAWLEDHIGELIMFRDNKGRVIFGTYQDIRVFDRRIYSDAVAAITITEVTHSLEE